MAIKLAPTRPRQKKEKKEDLPVLLLFGLAASGLVYWLTRRPKPQIASLSGTVYQLGTTNVIPDATVTLGAETTTSDADGKYSFANLTPGSFSGTAEAAGYYGISFDVTLPAGAQTHDIELEPVPEPLAQATINGTLLEDGGASAVNAYFQYGLDQGSLTETTPAQIATMGNQFSETLVNLARATTYYFQAVASDGANTVLGEILNFTTP